MTENINPFPFSFIQNTFLTACKKYANRKITKKELIQELQSLIYFINDMEDDDEDRLEDSMNQLLKESMKMHSEWINKQFFGEEK